MMKYAENVRILYWRMARNIEAEFSNITAQRNLLISLATDCSVVASVGYSGKTSLGSPRNSPVSWESVWICMAATTISKHIEDVVTTCTTCHKQRENHAEPMIPTTLTERPWQKVATYLFRHNGKNYIIYGLKSGTTWRQSMCIGNFFYNSNFVYENSSIKLVRLLLVNLL